MADRNGYIGRSPGDSAVVIARQSFSPTGIQTNFTFSSGYTVGYIDLYLNGARLVEGQDFTATDGSVVGLTTNAVDGDVLELVAYKAFNAANVSAATGNFSVGGNLSVTGNTELTGTLTVGGVEVQPGAAGTWASYDSNTGISTTKKVKVDNDFEVTGVGTFASRVSIGDSIFHVGDDNTAFGFPAADTFTVYTGGSERVRIDSDGDVGIGTDNPTSKLHVNGGVLVKGPATPNINFSPLSGSSGNADISFDGNDLRIVSNSSGADVRINAFSRDNDFVIKSSGNIGINTNSPDGRLHVFEGLAGTVTANGNANDLVVENSTTGGISILTPDANHGYIIFGSPTSNEGAILRYKDADNLFTIGTEDADGQVVFRSGAGTERLRIGSSGQIGLSGANYGSTGQVLTSNGSSSAPTWQDASGGDSLDVTASLFI